MPRSDLWPAKHAQDQHFVDRISARAADARAQRQEDTLKELDGAEDEVAPVGAQCQQEEALKALDGAEDGVEMRHVSFQPDALEEAAGARGGRWRRLMTVFARTLLWRLGRREWRRLMILQWEMRR